MDMYRQNVLPYLAHNSRGRAVRLDDELQTGFELYQTQIGNRYMACIVDKDIEPSVDQQGLVFDLDEFYYPAWAVGPNSVNDQGQMTSTLTKHSNKQPYDQPINIVKSTEILTTTTTTTAGPSTTTPDDDGSDDILKVSECDDSNEGGSKGCMRSPSDCQSKSTCEVFVSYRMADSRNGAVRFELFTKTSKGDEYIAFGLTDDRMMDNASVIVCGMNAGKTGLTTYLAYNSKKDSEKLPDELQTGISMVSSEMTGDYIRCVIERDIEPTAEQQGLVFNLNEKFFPGWAVGLDSGGMVQPHRTKAKGDAKVQVTKGQSTSSKDRDLYIRLHIILMIFGWTVCVGSSILTPRYLRRFWTADFCCDVQFWFAIHRAFMVRKPFSFLVQLFSIMVKF